jgi:hypothetical protein
MTAALAPPTERFLSPRQGEPCPARTLGAFTRELKSNSRNSAVVQRVTYAVAREYPQNREAE